MPTLRFQSQEQRRQDALAGLIPRQIWERFFQNQSYGSSDYLDGLSLGEIESALMQTGTDSLINKLSVLGLNQSQSTLSTEIKMRYWLAVAFTHPDISDELLRKTGLELGLSEQQNLQLAAIFGRESYFNQVLHNDDQGKSSRFSWINRIQGENSQFTPFIEAAANGNLHLVKNIKEQVDNYSGAFGQQLAMRGYEAYRLAAANGYVDVMDELAKNTPNVHDMIEINDYRLFRNAAENGFVPEIEYLIKNVQPAKIPEMLASKGFEAFIYAAKNGHLEILNRLIDIQAKSDVGNLGRMVRSMRNLFLGSGLQSPLETMLEARDYAAFYLAAGNGHMNVMDRLMELSPNRIQLMIQAGGYAAFRLAIKNGHINVVDKLMALAPDKIQQMLSANIYEVFSLAVERGDLSTLNRLLALIEPNDIEEMLQTAIFRTYDNGRCNQQDIFNKLCQYPSVFAHVADSIAVTNGQQPGLPENFSSRFMREFVQDKIQSMHDQQQRFEEENDDPNLVFDIHNTEETKLYLYMANYLITQIKPNNPKNPELIENTKFILEIPAVRRIAASPIPDGPPNRLLNSATRMANQEIIDLLLDIPAVREQVLINEANPDPDNDLRRIAQQKESSMNALTAKQKERIQEALTRYTPKIEELGKARVVDMLRDDLVTRYQNLPAKIKRDKSWLDIILGRPAQELDLPLDWESFQALSLSTGEREKALEAYYQNKDHTAWRYLLKPNPWMSEKANYVYPDPRDPARPNERWSAFVDFEPEIALFYLAASDKGTPATDGFTIETRMDHFVDEIAHLGRAHNWDTSREIIKANGRIGEEEYDDLGPDRPSCRPGTSKRLAQSVLGHPLFSGLTEEKVNAELRDFVRDCFMEKINDGNRAALKRAWDEVIDTGSDKAIMALKALDISEEKQAEFFQKMANDYGKQFTEDESLTKLVTQAFTFMGAVDAHAARFGYVGIEMPIQSLKIKLKNLIVAA